MAGSLYETQPNTFSTISNIKFLLGNVNFQRYLLNSIKAKVLIYFLTFIIRGEAPCEEMLGNHLNNKLWIVFLLSETFAIKVAKLVIISVFGR